MILVNCARVPISLPPATVAHWIGALPVSRRPVIEGRLKNSRGLESLTALALLASLAKYCRIPPLASLHWSRYGKPEFPDGPKFSITHAGGYASCAVALDGSVIGIDMEDVRRARAATVRLVAHHSELAQLSGGLFTPAELWTAKEAVIKAAGATLSDMVRVRLEGKTARFGRARYFIRHRSLVGSLVMSVATSNSSSLLTVRWLDARRLFQSDRHACPEALSA